MRLVIRDAKFKLVKDKEGKEVPQVLFKVQVKDEKEETVFIMKGWRLAWGRIHPPRNRAGGGYVDWFEDHLMLLDWLKEIIMQRHAGAWIEKWPQLLEDADQREFFGLSERIEAVS